MHPLPRLLQSQRTLKLLKGFSFFICNTNDGQEMLLSCGHYRPKTGNAPYPLLAMLPCSICQELVP